MIVIEPVGKYVDAKSMLIGSSASAITTFDDSTPFGCQRKSWFEVRAGLKGPPTKSLLLGDQVHKQIEHYLVTGQDALGKEARAGKGHVDALKACFPVFQIEQWIETLTIAGVKIRGRVDFTGRIVGDPRIKAIVDWKTTSDFQKWGKTSNQLKKDTQMLIYRAAAEIEGCDENLEMMHVYFGTNKRESEIVRTTINRQQLADGIGDITSKLEQMKSVMRITNSEEVKPDRSKCGNCPYVQHCPAPGASSFMASLTSKFKAAAQPEIKQIAPNPDTEVTKTGTTAALARDSVLPPDAPKSDPKLAADPVEGFSPLPAPRSQGEVAAVVAQEKTKKTKPVKVEAMAADFEVTEMTVNVGATVKAIPNDPKCFEFIRVDISLRATVRAGADLASVRGKLSDMANAGLTEEIEKRLPKS